MIIFQKSIPESCPTDIIAWAELAVKVDGHSFDSSRTPQLIEPIRAMADPDTRIGTLVKPVQVGGSTAGEVVMCYWASFYNGLLQFNWENDLKATNRWGDRLLPALESCKDIKRTGHRFEELICEARYINCTVRCQGVFKEDALDSDTVPLQINEEIHSWKPGFLSKARRRQTQVWNAKAFDISNAGNVSDQLHEAYDSGTSEIWEVLCPQCGQHHEMRFRWNPNKPELGGLRWDSSGCKMENGRFNYNKLDSTIRYQFPCGHSIRDYASERRLLKGRYRITNEGAHHSHKSWTFEAVSCDSIRWLSLIQEWHSAIRALKVGDKEPMRRFRTERECRFYDDDTLPFSGQIIINSAVSKTREGLQDRAARLWAADWQQGMKAAGELTHFWLVIEDVLSNCTSQIVFEGMVSTEPELISTLDAYECLRTAGVVDVSKNTKQLLSFCYREGLNAVSGITSHRGSFRHKDGVLRFYSEEKPVHHELNMPPKFDYHPGKEGWVLDPREPVVISYNKAGLLANHFFIRDFKANVLKNNPQAQPTDYIERVIPGDVSEDFQQQMESWERVANKQTRTNDEVEGFRKLRRADHMFMCCAYIDLLKEQTGLLGDQLARMGIRR